MLILNDTASNKILYLLAGQLCMELQIRKLSQTKNGDTWLWKPSIADFFIQIFNKTLIRGMKAFDMKII